MFLRNRGFWLRVLFSAVIVAMVLHGIDWTEATHSLGSADYLFLLPALVSNLVMVLLRSARWKFLLSKEIQISMRSSLSLVAIGRLGDALIPGVGEISRAYVARSREKFAASYVVGTIVLEKVIDSSLLLLTLVMLLILLPLPSWVVIIVIGVGAILLCAAAALFLLTALAQEHSTRISRAISILPPYMRVKLTESASAFGAGFQTFSKAKWRQRCAILTLSLLVWATTYAMYYFVLSSFSFALPVYASLFVMAAVNLGTAIPVAVGGIGTFQALVVISLALFGIDSSAALTSSVVLHGVVALPAIMLGLFFLYGVRQVDQSIPIRRQSVNK